LIYWEFIFTDVNLIFLSNTAANTLQMDAVIQDRMHALLHTYDLETKDFTKEKLTINSFSLICVIGKGSYAKVVVARKRDTGKIYALKIVKKSRVEQRNNQEYIKTERSILAEIQHPFIIKMSYAFQSENKLYFALEYCAGGELFNLLQKKRRFKEEQAKFYTVQVLLALEHLHKFDIIYRDLKPENILIDTDGYLRLIDFGLSKKGVKTNKGAKSDCGTPEYLAPEILFRKEHGRVVDYWTLGAFLFEMLTGLPPFYSADREELFNNIKFKVLKYPYYLSSTVKSLLDGLLEKDPEKRLGSGPGATQEIKDHPWFQDVEWEAYLKKEVKAPFIPVIQNELDFSNFDQEFTETSIESYGENIFEEGKSYPEWSYTGSGSFQRN